MRIDENDEGEISLVGLTEADVELFRRALVECGAEEIRRTLQKMLKKRDDDNGESDV